MFKTLMSAQELRESYAKDSWVVVDCRFSLKNPSAGYDDYLEAHIPDAVYAHLDKDLSGKTSPRSGRHPLPENFGAKLGHWGINGDKQVVVYDDNGGAIASRLWWMLRYFGHEKVAVLNGGWDAWRQKEYPIQHGVCENTSVDFVEKLREDMLISFDTMKEIYNSPEYRVIDSRSHVRFCGREEPIDPVAGHIPGAVNYCHECNVNAQKLFIDNEQLQKQLEEVLVDSVPEKTIFYCGSGVTACRNLLAMEHLGKCGAKLFLGSWSEWCRNTELPIATE
ncbi:sulfurtransferase [Candidatus Uabimicrobium amorphum]|uniref:Sulfurtransferase n=1 Tax=Uabimicrobium amorphum TaxID=2596890 RepID=A0A5S9IVG6_UABAM|nr:sulfurtransferase [Candidatus Uabimicrobium amorphum]BBM87315.1 sulfurtransferase [Candidatus Uabimicrobium amorphum]